MAAAANFAFANRHAMAHCLREAIAPILSPQVAEQTRQVYDLTHNVAKIERDGGRELLGKGPRVHSPLGRSRFPQTSGRSASPCSFPEAWAQPASCWPAWPVRLSARSAPPAMARGERCRGRARTRIGGGELRRQLETQGIVVRCASNKGLAEEAPFAYKDVERVVRVVEHAGLARRVARLVPLGVVKV